MNSLIKSYKKDNRLFFVYFCILLSFLVIISRISYLVVFNNNLDLVGSYKNKKITKRADIIDRNGIIVATDLDIKLLYANATLIRDPKFVAKKLSTTFSDLNYTKLLSRLSKSKDGWLLIKRNITPRQEQIINNLGIAGLIFEESKVRVYPQKSALSHVLGYVDLDGKGISGIEKEYDDLLDKGEHKLQLSVDLRVQDILNNELEKALNKYKAFAAFGLIIDVNNGEVIALSSVPNFDINNQSEALKKEKFNRTSYGVYEIGSIFKIFNHALAIEDNLVKIKDEYSVKEPVKIGKFTIDDDHKDKDILTVEEIFTKSSNIGSVKIAQLFGQTRQKEFLETLGLLTKVKADFPSLAKPIFPRRWGKISLATIAFGHGIAVTPLHVANGVSAIVNGGKLHAISFTKLKEKPKSKQVISKKTSLIMRDLLRKTVVSGTGKKANVAGYEVGGKTGTAEMAEAGSYNKDKTLASFLAVFPSSRPRYIVFVGIDRPNYTFNTGGMVGAPVAGEIIKNIGPILY